MAGPKRAAILGGKKRSANQTYAEVLFDYDQLINTRQTPKSYSQQLQDFTTLKNLRIKLFIWAYLVERGRHSTPQKIVFNNNDFIPTAELDYYTEVDQPFLEGLLRGNSQLARQA
jgi:hypothetical protein